MGWPANKDAKGVPGREMKPAAAGFRFVEAEFLPERQARMLIDDWTTNGADFVHLNDLNRKLNTLAFLVIRNDTIVFEQYYEGYDSSKHILSFSLAKSFTSAMMGIAIKKGYLPGLDAPVLDYIPELEPAEDFKDLKLSHLLNQTSGLDLGKLEDAGIYYGKRGMEKIKKVRPVLPPGKRQTYRNLNIFMLGLVLERATKMPFHEFMEKELWQPLGMEQPGYWWYDKKSGLTKNYGCLMAVARDYARLGRLYLKKGEWEGKQILDREWVEASVAHDTTAGSSWGYNRCWYPGLRIYGDFMAWGLYKNSIYVNPLHNIVIVRLGDRTREILLERAVYENIFRQIAEEF